MEFPILYRDAHYIAIEKPAGLLVHRTGLSDDRTFVLQELRNQIGQHVFPVHRLDRGTTGVLVFGLDGAAASALQTVMESGASNKSYLAIVRGWPVAYAMIDSPLAKDLEGEMQPAQTEYWRLATAELPVAVDRYESARYAMVGLRLHTGRMHQVRRHMAHVRHPVICDRKHGDRHHNRMWEEQLGFRSLLLHAWRLSFRHPYTQAPVVLQASPSPRFVEAMTLLDWRLEDIEAAALQSGMPFDGMV